MSLKTRKSDTHEERYFHIQLKDQPNSRLRAVTIFARKDNLTGLWDVSGAFCHKEDKFDRKIGRQVARRRFFQDPQHVIRGVGEITYEKAVELAQLAGAIWT